MKHAKTTDDRGWASLALGVCYLQDFYATYDDDMSSSLSDSVRAAFGYLVSAAESGNALAQSIVPRLAAKIASNASDTGSRYPLEQWLVNAICQGSARARNELRRNFPGTYDHTTKALENSYEELGNKLDATISWPPPKGSLGDLEVIHPTAKAILAQVGVTRLQFGAFIGALRVCEEIAATRGPESLIEEPNILHYAALGGSPTMVGYLLRAGVKAGTQTESGVTPLHACLLSHCPEGVLPILLSHSADPNVICTSSKDWPFEYGSYYSRQGTPLHLAVHFEDTDAAKLLLEAGADPNMKDSIGFSALEETLRLHSTEMLEIILPYAVKDTYNVPDMDELYPPLAGHRVSSMQKHVSWPSDPPDTDFVQCAIDHNLHYGLSFDYRGLLVAAVEADNAEVTDICLRKLCSGHEHGESLHPYRCRKQWAPTVAADANVSDFPLSPDLGDLLFGVVSVCSAELVEVVLRFVPRPLPSHGPMEMPIVNAVSQRRFTSKMDAIRIVDALVAAGADVSAVDEYGHGALGAAVFTNNYHVVDALLKYPFPLKDIEDALAFCLREGGSRVAEFMFNRIISKRPEVLVTPLPKPRGFLSFDDRATMTRDTNFLRAVCDIREFGRDDDINERILRNIIAKTRAQPGGDQALKERLDEFAHPPFQNTPLHHATARGNYRAAKLLVDAGAQVNLCHLDEWPDFSQPDLPGDCALDVDLSFLTVNPLLASMNRGPSPLDHAYYRNWDYEIYQYMGEHRELIKQLKQAGGTHKEEADFAKRTNAVIAYLRSKGAKTKAEIYGGPDTAIARANAQEIHKQKMEYKPPSATSQRIMGFYGSAVGLPSAQITMSAYPHLIDQADRRRPRFSTLFAETEKEFRKVLESHQWAREEMQFRTRLAEILAQYVGWAERDNVRGGSLDAIQAVPPGPRSIILAAALTLCFAEIVRTLELIWEFLSTSAPETRRE